MTRTDVSAFCAAALLFVTTASASDFHMIHATRGNASIGVFTPEGPQLGTMQKGARRVDFITFDSNTGTYFGQQVSTLGVIEDGKLTPVVTPDSVDLSHSGGLAFDAARESVLVASKSGAGTVLFECTPATSTWNEIGNIGRDDYHGLACDAAQGLIFTLDKPRQKRMLTNLRVFIRTGAQVAAVDLSTPIPYFDDLRPKLQLAFAEGLLYAMVTYEKRHPRVADAIFAIDPVSGEVTRTAFNAKKDLTSKTWRGWKGGPPPSSPMSSDAQGSGFYSNYESPKSLMRPQQGELHVIAVQSGETNYLEYLKKIKKLRAGAKKGGGVELELELDLDAEIRHPVVEVFVNKSKKPVTLALASAQTVIWSIEAAPGARIASVVTFGDPFFSNSKVIGVDPGIITEGEELQTACAWELEQTSSATHFDEMIKTIREKTGLRENSYRGLPMAASFHLP